MHYAKIKDLPHVKELIRAEAKIEDVARSLYGLDLRPAGDDGLKACCPFHTEDTPSFGISKSKQLYHCFGCHVGGDVFSFVEGMDSCDFAEALRKVAEFARFDLSPYREAYTEEDKRKQELYNINNDVLEYARTQTTNDIFAHWRNRRRFDPDILAEYGVGYSPSALDPGLIPAAGVDEATALGLDREGQWSNAIVVPLRDPYGRVAGFRNRMLSPDAQVKVQGPRSEHGLPVPIVYGLYEARKHIRAAGYLLLVEGEPDVWQLASHGYRNVAAIIGSHLSEELLQLLGQFGIHRVVLLADADDPGRKLSRKVAEARYPKFTGLLKIATLTGNGKDPDEILLADGKDPIDAAIGLARHQFEYHIERVCDGHDVKSRSAQLDILTELREWVAAAPQIERELVARRLSEVLALDYEVVVDFFRESEAGGQAQLNNVQAERIVLKRALSDSEFVGEALLGLRPSDFYLARHRAIFEAIGKLYRGQQDITPDTVRVFVENKTGDTARATIEGIMADAVDASSAEFMLAELRDKAIRRDVQKAARDAGNQLSVAKIDAREVVQKLSTSLSAAIVGSGDKTTEVGEIVRQRVQLMHDRIREPNAIIGYDLGQDWPILNHTLHGLQRSRYVILSAPTGVGKTAIAGSLVKRLAVELKIPALYLTFETGKDALTDRLISSCSGVESDKVITGFVTPEEARLVHDAAERIAAAPLVITERGIVYEEGLALIRHDVLKRGTKVVVVDYLQLQTMTAADARLRRDQELGLMSRGYLEIAKELDIALIALAQQNRESAKNKGMTKEDIGESYKIMQDADVGLAVRDKTQDEIDADGPEKGNKLARLVKHRHGRDGITFNLIADMGIMRIKEYAATRTTR